MVVGCFIFKKMILMAKVYADKNVREIMFLSAFCTHEKLIIYYNGYFITILMSYLGTIR